MPDKPEFAFPSLIVKYLSRVFLIMPGESERMYIVSSFIKLSFSKMDS